MDAATIDKLSKDAIASIESHKIEQAIKILNEILAHDPAHPLSLWNRSIAFMRVGSMHAALLDLYGLLKVQPRNLEARNQIRFIHRKLIGNWHFDMMNDQVRNGAYEKAILAAVNKDTTVFEIGTGSGLLSMLAARAGAQHVYSCEKEMPIRRAASEIIRKNGLSEKITLLDKWSTSVAIPRDMPQKADLIIAEVFGPGLLEEQALHFFDDAKLRLLKTGGKIIPSHAIMYCALLESNEISERAIVKNVCGFDVSLFNGLHDDPAIQVNLKNHSHVLLSDPIEVKSIDFLNCAVTESNHQIDITVTATGTCHGVVQWFRLYTDKDNFIDTSPFAQRTHWDQQAQIFEKPFPVVKGQKMSFTAHQFADRFSLQPILTP